MKWLLNNHKLGAQSARRLLKYGSGAGVVSNFTEIILIFRRLHKTLFNIRSTLHGNVSSKVTFCYATPHKTLSPAAQPASGWGAHQTVVTGECDRALFHFMFYFISSLEFQFSFNAGNVIFPHFTVSRARQRGHSTDVRCVGSCHKMSSVRFCLNLLRVAPVVPVGRLCTVSLEPCFTLAYF